jgi:DNA-binding transcriptional ArsR family regulator
MGEVVASLRALRAPDRATLHLPWIEETRGRLAELDLLPVLAMLPPTGYIPDFLTPPPTTPLASFADELATFRATPARQVRYDMSLFLGRRRPPTVLEPFVKRPKQALARLTDVLERYWEVAMAPHWPRVRALLEADLQHRARRLTDGGPAALFSDLHHQVSWSHASVALDIAYETDVELGGRGLLLVPSAFASNCPWALTEPPWQPTVLYPARGLALLWEPGLPAVPEALAGVLGRTRAGLLLALDAPRSTVEVARRLEISPGGASQHLTALRDAGLVSARRAGRTVLYARTPLGEALAGSPAPAAVG